MADHGRAGGADAEFEKITAAALHPNGVLSRTNQLLQAGGLVGRRDPLSELQQQLIIAAIARIDHPLDFDRQRSTGKMPWRDFLALCAGETADATVLTGEIEKMIKKGLWLSDGEGRKLTRTSWFQAIEYTDQEIIFQFSEKTLALIRQFSPADAELQLVKGLRYKGKHTLAVFEIIWRGKNKGLTEYSIPQLMQQLSLAHTRYSYGQLKLRVLEPAIAEIYAWDEEMFVRFGPTFSGRRVEGVWFEVLTGDAARELRQEQPEFKFSLPEEKPDKES